MTRSIDENIDQFLSFFRERFDEIANITNVLYAHQYQKMLFLSAVDALARVRWPNGKSNQKRFTTFVDEFANWSDGCRVSMPHLDKLLKITKDPRFSDLRTFVQQELKRWTSGKVLSLNVDPEIGEVEKLWPKLESGDDAKLDGLSITSFTHIKLLYTCRNALVHEFRSPSADFSSAGPCYIHQTNILPEGVKKGDVWILSYPVSFNGNIWREVSRSRREMQLA